jgi:hypothetical protein
MAKKREKHLKPVSRGDDPLPDLWLEEHSDLLSTVRFARKPTSVETGDLLVLYALGSRNSSASSARRCRAKTLTRHPSTGTKIILGA